MAMDENDAFWQSFLGRDEVQNAIKLEQKMLIHEQAKKLEEEYKEESAVLKENIKDCDEEVQKLIFPLLTYPMVHRILFNFLNFCKEKNLSFSEYIKSNDSLLSQLKILKEEYEANPNNVQEIQNRWRELCMEAKEKIEEEKQNEFMYTSNYSAQKCRKKKTWKDMPQDELAERLSKGEIMPRDEWIPGISKGKRRLDVQSLKQHLALGEEMRNSGKNAYQKEDYDMAFIRFTQGVQLLNWVEGTNEEDNAKIEELYLTHLNNQAQAALKLNKYQDAIKACTSVLQEIDEYDDKARYRRGKAYLYLGLVKAAKDDFMFILKSPYADDAAKSSARYGMRELRKILCKANDTTKQIFNQSVQNDLFSENREVEKEEKINEEEESEEEENTNRFFDKKDNFSQNASPAEKEKDEKEKEKSLKLGVEETKEMLEDILELYTSEEVQKKFCELRRLADFEERRFLLRLKNYLPEILADILNKYGFNTHTDFALNKREMERTVTYWRMKDEEVKMLSKECWNAVFDQLPDDA